MLGYSCYKLNSHYTFSTGCMICDKIFENKICLEHHNIFKELF